MKEYESGQTGSAFQVVIHPIDESISSAASEGRRIKSRFIRTSLIAVYRTAVGQL